MYSIRAYYFLCFLLLIVSIIAVLSYIKWTEIFFAEDGIYNQDNSHMYYRPTKNKYLMLAFDVIIVAIVSNVNHRYSTVYHNFMWIRGGKYQWAVTYIKYKAFFFWRRLLMTLFFFLPCTDNNNNNNKQLLCFLFVHFTIRSWEILTIILFSILNA